MKVKTISRFLLPLLMIAVAVQPTRAAADEEELDTVGHTADGFYLDFSPFAVIELPRLFVVRGEGGRLYVDGFASTKAAVASGRFVIVTEDEPGVPVLVTEPEAAEDMIARKAHLYAGIAPVDGRAVLDLSITRHLVFGMLAALLTLLVFISLARRYARGLGRETAPRGIFQNMFESAVVFVRDEVARPNLGDKTDRFLPYLLTAFFFILFCNLLGLVPYGASATANLSVTLVLASFTFVLGQVFATKDHWLHIFWPPGVPFLIKLLLIPVEFIGLFTRHLALAIRLFANMMAGSLVILSLIGLIFTFQALFGAGAALGVAPVSILMTLFISLVKLLIAFIQAYVFTMLSALFIGMAVAEHHDHGVQEFELTGAESETSPALGGDGELRERTDVVKRPEPIPVA